MNDQQAQEYRLALEAGEKPPEFDEETTVVNKDKSPDQHGNPADKKNDDAGDDRAKPEAEDKGASQEAEGRGKEEVQDKEPPSLEERVESMQGTIDKLQGRLRKAEGRVGSLTDQLKRASRQSRQEEKDSRIQAIKQKREGMIDNLIEEYPEFAEELGKLKGDVMSLTEDEIKELTSVEAEDPELESSNIERINRNIDNNKDLTGHQKTQLKLMFAYDEQWPKVQKGQDFKEWFANQPPDIQELENSDLAKDWIRLHTLFLNRDRKPTAKEINEQRKQQASRTAHHHRSGNETLDKPVELMNEQEYRQYKEAQRENK